MVLGLAAAASIALWRAGANTPPLNDDPIPWVSPNDLLSPILTYVAVDAFCSLTGLRHRPDRPRLLALVVLITFLANVLTI